MPGQPGCTAGPARNPDGTTTFCSELMYAPFNPLTWADAGPQQLAPRSEAGAESDISSDRVNLGIDLSVPY